MKYVFAVLFFITSFSAQALTILAFGDSLMSGYGLEEAQGFVPQLEKTLERENIKARVVNAAVAGNTTGDGLARLDWSLSEKPDFVLLALGANDALRGLDPEQAKLNLEEIIKQVQKENIPIFFIGMKALRNWGPEYVAEFDAIFPDIAAKYHLPFYPFFLEGVATKAELNQPDGLHPNPEGVKIIVQQMLPSIKKALSDR